MDVGTTDGMQINNTALTPSDATIFLGVIGDASSKLPSPSPFHVSAMLKSKNFCRRVVMQMLGFENADEDETGATDEPNEDCNVEELLLDVVAENMHQQLLLSLGVLMCSSKGKAIKDLRHGISCLKDALHLKKKLEMEALASKASQVKDTAAAAADLERLRQRTGRSVSAGADFASKSATKVHPLDRTTDAYADGESNILLNTYILTVELTFVVLEQLLQRGDLQGEFESRLYSIQSILTSSALCELPCALHRAAY
jgi:hypothetical protein